jgi:hypothetical protein
MARLMNLLSVAKLSEKAIPPFIICREWRWFEFLAVTEIYENIEPLFIVFREWRREFVDSYWSL